MKFLIVALTAISIALTPATPLAQIDDTCYVPVDDGIKCESVIVHDESTLVAPTTDDWMRPVRELDSADIVACDEMILR